MNQEKIGKFILNLRKKYNLTQAQLAKKLNVTSQAISKWENGRGIPDIELLKKLSEEFNVSISDLIEGENTNKTNWWVYLIFLITIITVMVLVLIFTNSTENSFVFNSLVCDNDSFSIDGVIAYNDSKKSIYISNIEYCNENNEEPKYIAVECILYENTSDGKINKIAKYGSLNNPLDNSSYISDLLKDIEFNIDDYDCGCNNKTCNNLTIVLNALDENGDTVLYEIPIEIDNTCN